MKKEKKAKADVWGKGGRVIFGFVCFGGGGGGGGGYVHLYE